MSDEPLTFGSLFAGIGGIDLGLERAGMVCKWQVEIDDYATRLLERHWPNVRRWRDVKTFPPDTESIRLSEHVGRFGKEATEEQWGRVSESCRRNYVSEDWYVDLICGGFPCQDISYAGRGAGLAGERSGLFFEVVRVVRQLQPRYVLLENVAALLTRGLDRVLGELAQIGYDAEWHCLPAAAVGAPHIRDRVFVLAYANDARVGAPGSGVDGLRSQAEDAKQSQPQPEPSGHGESADANESRLEKRPIIASNARAKLAAIERSNREPGGQWAVEPDVGRVAHGVPNRVDRLRGLGNAVVPQVAEWIGRRLIQVVCSK